MNHIVWILSHTVGGFLRQNTLDIKYTQRVCKNQNKKKQQKNTAHIAGSLSSETIFDFVKGKELSWD